MLAFGWFLKVFVLLKKAVPLISFKQQKLRRRYLAFSCLLLEIEILSPK
jgi:hypothetical protein